MSGLSSDSTRHSCFDIHKVFALHEAPPPFQSLGNNEKKVQGFLADLGPV